MLFSAKPPVVPESELVFSFSRSSGPGGQNVNKTSTKVRLRWHVGRSGSFSEAQKSLIRQAAGSRLNRRSSTSANPHPHGRCSDRRAAYLSPSPTDKNVGMELCQETVPRIVFEIFTCHQPLPFDKIGWSQMAIFSCKSRVFGADLAGFTRRGGLDFATSASPLSRRRNRSQGTQ